MLNVFSDEKIVEKMDAAIVEYWENTKSAFETAADALERAHLGDYEQLKERLRLAPRGSSA